MTVLSDKMETEDKLEGYVLCKLNIEGCSPDVLSIRVTLGAFKCQFQVRWKQSYIFKNRFLTKKKC